MPIDAEALTAALLLGAAWLVTGAALVVLAAVSPRGRTAWVLGPLIAVQIAVLGLAIATWAWILIPPALVFLLAGAWALRRPRPHPS